MNQMALPFEANFITRHEWEMTSRARAKAADILVQCLRNGMTRVTFGDIVKEKLKINGDSIPEDQAHAYANGVDAVFDERYHIKEAVEATGEFSLTIADSENKPAIRGGRPAIFVSRLSSAGMVDDVAQLMMARGKMRATSDRLIASGVITAEQRAQVVEQVDAVIGFLSDSTEAPAV